MFSFLVRPLRATMQTLLSGDSSRQLAAGFSLGMVLGLLPKGNLIAMTLCVLIFSLRVNTGLALVAAVLFSWVGVLGDSFTHQLGSEVLHIGVLQAGYASLYNLPLGPWLGFHNSVVMGSLLVGLYLVYPAYWASYAGSRWLQPRLNGRSALPSAVSWRPVSAANSSPRREAEPTREAA
jgi:uncharacterized protein (TIGR03546 family)